MMRWLFKLTLYVVVVELLVTGGLCLVAPAVAAQLWSYPIKDEALVRVLGPPWIVIGLMWLTMARDLDRYRHVIWLPILGTFLQLGRAVAGVWSGELAPEVSRPPSSGVARSPRRWRGRRSSPRARSECSCSSGTWARIGALARRERGRGHGLVSA